MSTLLLLGLGPYPTELGAAVSGPAIRARQFAEPLAAAGHEVVVGLLEGAARKVFRLPGGRVRAFAVTPEMILDARRMEAGLGPLAQRLDGVLGVGSLMPATAAARLGAHLGVASWVDLFGDPLAEWHAEATFPGAAVDLVRRDHVWKLMREALLHGDRFSAVSERQRCALLGQLLLLGRLSQQEGDHHRVATIPCGIPESWLAQPVERPAFPAVLGERGVAEGTPYLFVGGSWTHWLAARRMGEALREWLEATPEGWVVVRGGTPGEANRAVAEAFLAGLGKGHPRVVTLDGADAPEGALLAHARAAVLLDRDVPERFLGDRNRLLAWLRGGVPIITNTRAEVAEKPRAAGLLIDGEELERASLAEVLARPRPAAETSARELLESLTFSRTLEPALAWAAAPERWPAEWEWGLQRRWAEWLPTEP